MCAARISPEQIESAIQGRDFQRAEALLETVNRDPSQRSLKSLMQYGVVLEAQQKFGAASVAFEAVEPHAVLAADKVAALNRASDLLYVHHRERISRDVMDRMAGLLERSVAIEPSGKNVQAITKLCNIYQTQADAKALATCASILAEIPECFIDSQLWLAAANFTLGQKKQGLAHMRSVQDSRSQLSSKQLFWLLGLLIQYREFQSADELIDLAHSRNYKDDRLLEYQAQIAFESRDYAAVLRIVTGGALASCENAPVARRLYYYRGMALEEGEDYSGAYESFRAMNEIAASSYVVNPGAASLNDLYAVAANALGDSHTGDSLPYQLVFMVAFPRSGTTLLETVLDTQPEIATLSEVDSVLELRRRIERLGRHYPVELSALTGGQVDDLRGAYTGCIDDYLENSGDYSVVVDKLPLNIIHVPLIAKVLPEARFVLSLRHPFDVCLSCFQQDFLLNDQMAFFTSLEGCFMRYRDVMGLFEHYREHLDLNLHIVRYEDLVDGFEESAARVFDFLGVSPDESYKEFHSINQKKLIATPSRSQVIRPVYQSSCYRWLRYSDLLEPYKHHVQRFVDRYGYSSDAA